MMMMIVDVVVMMQSESGINIVGQKEDGVRNSLRSLLHFRRAENWGMGRFDLNMESMRASREGDVFRVKVRIDHLRSHS